MTLLIFFAIPLATILLAIVLEKVLHCPILVTITFFAIYLVTLFALYATSVITNLAAGLVAIIVYTILAFITAYIVKIIKTICSRFFNNNIGEEQICNSCLNNIDNCQENNTSNLSTRNCTNRKCNTKSI